MSSHPPPRIGFVGESTADASHYTPWFTRVLAYVIDSIPVYLLAIIGGVVLSAWQVETTCVSGAFCATGGSGPSTTAWIIFSVCVLIAMVFSLWNFVVRQGNTGSSIGKQMMKFKVVGEQTQEPIGIFRSLLRQLAHGIDALICYVGFLFPLWDAKRQTIADKLMKTVCVPL
ncbi:RDD family protein [Mycolicibacterium tusciae]|uniref:RDD family protein n=1 Tax=Mycolicibacterium tusciae TaxID=75922 RepID=UPI00024A32F7|nr:RDD family protein [Mycolicibacterium tusciae]